MSPGLLNDLVEFEEGVAAAGEVPLKFTVHWGPVGVAEGLEEVGVVGVGAEVPEELIELFRKGSDK